MLGEYCQDKLGKRIGAGAPLQIAVVGGQRIINFACFLCRRKLICVIVRAHEPIIADRTQVCPGATVSGLLGRAYGEVDLGAKEGSDTLSFLIELFAMSIGKGNGWRDDNIETFTARAATPDARRYAVDEEERKAHCALVAGATQGWRGTP